MSCVSTHTVQGAAISRNSSNRMPPNADWSTPAYLLNVEPELSLVQNHGIYVRGEGAEGGPFWAAKLNGYRVDPRSLEFMERVAPQVGA